MDARLRAIERQLRAEGVVYKVLDERSIGLLKVYFEEKVREHTVAAGRFQVRGRLAMQTQAFADAVEKMNQYATLLELILP